MPLKIKTVEERLQEKFGFSRAEHRSDDHRWYELTLPGIPTISTKFSHGAKELSSTLEGLIAKQLRVRKAYFVEMIECTKSSAEYREQVRTAPFPPFDVRF